jgi:Tfp pilus assembly protein PilX
MTMRGINARCPGLFPRRADGAALPIVLVLVAMLLTLAVAALESSTLALRNAAHQHSRAQAFHAADAGVMLCAQRLEKGDAPVRAWAGSGEPGYWREHAAFDGAAPAAFAATPTWPLALRAPQCLIEQWTLPNRPEASAYLITARGFGGMADQQAWAQLIVVSERSGARSEQRWRSVAARPY